MAAGILFTVLFDFSFYMQFYDVQSTRIWLLVSLVIGCGCA